MSNCSYCCNCDYCVHDLSVNRYLCSVEFFVSCVSFYKSSYLEDITNKCRLDKRVINSIVDYTNTLNHFIFDLKIVGKL